MGHVPIVSQTSTTACPRLKVLSFSFSLSAEIERLMISSRTKEALARKKSEGKRLGHPKGRLSSVTKLIGRDDLIRESLQKKIPQTYCQTPKCQPVDHKKLHYYPEVDPHSDGVFSLFVQLYPLSLGGGLTRLSISTKRRMTARCRVGNGLVDCSNTTNERL